MVQFAFVFFENNNSFVMCVEIRVPLTVKIMECAVNITTDSIYSQKEKHF